MTLFFMRKLWIPCCGGGEPGGGVGGDGDYVTKESYDSYFIIMELIYDCKVNSSLAEFKVTT